MQEQPASERSIFEAAIDIGPPPQRAAYLDNACGSDTPLRREVEALLAAHDRLGGFHRDDTPTPAMSERPGSVIGPYRLLQQIGEGGMGAVFLAEQTKPIRRRVALKVIKPGLDTRQVIGRFEAERQALALMDHPNVARVLDAAATESGRPYFVMELACGLPITDYCDQQRLTIRQRLELFLGACRGVQHAHQKGVIHRDLKPSNVLVTPHEGAPVVKVIDFGIAKPIGRPLVEDTPLTGLGQMMGTPLYMSPEQARMNALDIDTRADIYSLGVLLYELLTGTTPLERQRVKEADLLEVLRLIRQEEPPKPSARLSASAELPALAGKRGLEPGKLKRLVRGELDWIVMKCLEKDRNRRYDTASALAGDLERYLADEPVLAGPPSTTYRLGKFLRRNRGPVLAGAVVLLALVGGIIGTTVGLVRAEAALGLAEGRRQEAEKARNEEAAERVRAEEERQIAQAILAFLQKRLLGQADPRAQAAALLRAGGASTEVKENPTIRELLDRAAREMTPDKIEAHFPKQPRVQAEVLFTIGDTYARIGAYRPAIAHLKRAHELRARALGPDHADTLAAMTALAQAHVNAGEQAQAVKLMERVRDRQLAKFGPDDPHTLAALLDLAWGYWGAGKRGEAARLLASVRDTQIAKFGLDHPATLSMLHRVAGLYYALGNTEEAIRLYELVRDKRVRAPDHPDALANLHQLAVAYQGTRKVPEAIVLFEQVRDRRARVLGRDHPDTLVTTHALARAYQATGRRAEARTLLEEVLAGQVARFGPDHPEALITLFDLASAHLGLGNKLEGIRLYEQARDRWVARFGLEHPMTEGLLHGLAGAYQSSGRNEEANRIHEHLWSRQLATHGIDHPYTSVALQNLAAAYRAAGKTAEGIRLLEQARDKTVEKHGRDHPRSLSALNAIASAHALARQFDQAIPLFEEVLKKRKVVLGVDDPVTVLSMNALGIAYRDAGRFPKAVVQMEEALAGARKINSPAAPQITRQMAVTYDQAGQFARSEALYRDFLKQERKQFGPGHLATAGTLAALGANLLAQKKFAEAEPLLRECLSSRTKAAPESWTTFSAQSLLGAALAGQKKYAEAEPFLLAGYGGMKKQQERAPNPWAGAQLKKALDRVVQMYEGWGKKDEAAKWRQKREAVPADRPMPKVKAKP